MSEPYCDKCERWFGSYKSLKQHIEDSNEHNACRTCGFDGDTWAELARHIDSRHSCGGRTCYGCSTVFWSHQDYWDHIEDDNVCTICNKHFNTTNGLRQHKRTHLPPSPPTTQATPTPRPNVNHTANAFECYGCDREFSRYGSMILHLESGSCPSNIDVYDLNRSAALCHQWSYFIDRYRDYRSDLLDEYEVYYDEYPFYCPECHFNFNKLSGLFQHIESSSCDQTLDDFPIDKLRKYLYKRHG